MTSIITVVDEGTPMSFTYEDTLHYHGNKLPGGAAHGYKALEAALEVLCPDTPPQRRHISVRTAFTGAGARDAIEMVTRAATHDRYSIDPALAAEERGLIAPYVFEFGYQERCVRVQVREGMVRDDFRQLVLKGSSRTPEEEQRVIELRREMADRLRLLKGRDVYAVVEGGQHRE